jgi:hypothetical protein
MHVLISVTAALLMQTPGVHVSALDAAVAVERAAVFQGRAATAGLHAAQGQACPCVFRRHVN